MGGHSNRSCSVNPIRIATPVPDLVVRGITTPNVAGGYFEFSVFNEKKTFRLTNGLFFIWYDAELPGYVISDEIGVTLSPWFYDPDYDIEPLGTYTPEGGATGNPIVTLT